MLMASEMAAGSAAMERCAPDPPSGPEPPAVPAGALSVWCCRCSSTSRPLSIELTGARLDLTAAEPLPWSSALEACRATGRSHCMSTLLIGALTASTVPEYFQGAPAKHENQSIRKMAMWRM